MSSYSEISPPDVDVIVEVSTASPTIALATLPAVVVGTCYQIVEVTEGGAANSSAILALPAVLAGTIDSPYNIGAVTKTIILKVNGGAAFTITLTEGGAQTAAQVVSDINAAFVTNSVDGAVVAEVIVGTLVTDTRVQIRTKATGTAKSLEITGGNAVGVLGFPELWRSVGVSKYNQTRMKASPFNFPAPRDNLDDLTFDPDEVTVAIDEGGTGLRLLSADSAVERAGYCDGVALKNQVIDDGDADGWSPWIELTVLNCKDEFDAAGAGAGLQGVAELGVAAASASITATNALVAPALDGKTLIISVSGSPFQTITFVLAGGDTIVEVIAQINAYFPGLASGAANLKLDTAAVTNGLAQKGREANIVIHKSSSSINPANLLDPPGGVAVLDANIFSGTWYPVAVGDEFYLSGELKGEVTRIISGGGDADLTCVFEISNELSEQDLADKHFYFVSKNLTGAATPGATPTPEVYVTVDGEVHIKNILVRDANGKSFWRYLTGGATEPIFYGQATVYLGYKALRKDVTAVADDPVLLSFDSTDEIDSEIGPISTDNPLAMGCYLCKLNCPGRTMYGLGIDEKSDSYPYGTSTAHTRAAEMLANHEIYTIVPLTQDLTILTSWMTHVTTYSGSDYKLERCMFGTLTIPTRGPNSSMASGTEGEKVSGTEFNTNLPGLTALMIEAGIDVTVADMTTPDLGVYLNIESNALNYHIKSVSGSIITVQTEVAHAFYSATDFTPLTLVNEAFSVMLRGSALVDGAGDPDKLAISKALADTASGFKESRVILGAPEQVEIIDSGLQMAVPSFYAACVEAGKKAELLPNVGFTNTSVPGIVRVKKSQDYFSAKQMNIAAGGGIWWWTQKKPTSPVTCRHQLTTDVTTIESREWSIQTPLDYLAKVVRMAIRPLLGIYNINEDLLRLVDASLDGIRYELVDNKKVFGSLEFGSLEPSEIYPDTLEVPATVGMFYPFNRMRVLVTTTTITI